MGDFSKGGVHKTDGLWWVIFQRGEYMKPMDFDGWFFKGGSTWNRWLLEIVLLLSKIERPGRLFRQIRHTSSSYGFFLLLGWPTAGLLECDQIYGEGTTSEEAVDAVVCYPKRCDHECLQSKYECTVERDFLWSKKEEKMWRHWEPMFSRLNMAAQNIRWDLSLHDNSASLALFIF